MVTQTPRFNLDKYTQGEEDWSHSDTVDLLDELAVETDVIANRDSSGDYDDELFYATDEKLLYRWDSNTSSWLVEGGIGTDTDKLPEIWVKNGNFNDIETSSFSNNATESIEDIVGALVVGGSNITVDYDDGDGSVTVESETTLGYTFDASQYDIALQGNIDTRNNELDARGSNIAIL
jgi:hypothetical protein